MLDADTKRKIDAARQTLVGKVPDPKAQVEQITIALIYKFMDDMDKESQELGGKATFFSDGFNKYSWSKILDRRLSEIERLDLYVQAITNISKNPNIPPLFKNIFKGAFLPYREPHTLSLFLKEIDGFTYDHSEDLGDAYEYLFSILGGQRASGQFRTPRHIIDFMVEVVNPQQNESILDPACGTAGFLISAFKHICKHNSSTFKSSKETTKEKMSQDNSLVKTVLDPKLYSGDLLAPEEKKKLMENIAGYDISPDMVRLSLVNMYLHGLPNLQIHEYDTLTSETRWGEQFDVILANPPFMTPKGGILPHKRFSVQVKRSEALFADYMLEHLSLKGRAGIIIPEGILFKIENAFKHLRQMLAEGGLWAVVSLPKGVFQPYTPIKTNILFLDKDFTSRVDEILFIEIKNDGFNLGAKRHEINKNDLPEALDILGAWKRSKKKTSPLASWVKKKQILQNNNYDLRSNQYPVKNLEKERIFSNQVSRKRESFKLAQLGDILTYEQPTKYLVKSTSYKDKHKTPVLTAGKTFILGHTDEKEGIYPKERLPVIIFDDFTTATKFVDFSFKVKSSAMKILSINDQSKGDIKFIFLAMQNIKFNSSTHKRYWISEYSKLKIPFPPLKVQKEIVAEVEKEEKVIEYNRQLIKIMEQKIKEVLSNI